MTASNVPGIIVEASHASSASTATTRTASASPTTKTLRSDIGSKETLSSLGSMLPNAHSLEALRLATDRKVLRAPSSSRRQPPVPPPKPSTSILLASRIYSRMTTRRCLPSEPESDGSAKEPMMTRNTQSRCSDVDDLESEFTKNKDRHSSAAGGGKASQAAIRVNDWPQLQAAVQKMLAEMTQQGAAAPQLSDADLKEAIQLLLEKRAREQQQQQQQKQQGEQQKQQGEQQKQQGEQQKQQKKKKKKQKQPLIASGSGVQPRRMTAQREVEMVCGFGDCAKRGGKESWPLRLIVCIAKPGGSTSEDEPVNKQEQPLPKLEAVEKLKVELPHSEPMVELEAAEENRVSPILVMLKVPDDDGVSLPGIELWRDSSSFPHNTEVPEAAARTSLAVASQAEPPQPKARTSKLSKQQVISSDEDRMNLLQQELMTDGKEQKVRDSKGINCDESEGTDRENRDKSSDDGDDTEGSGAELNVLESGISLVLPIFSRSSSQSTMPSGESSRELLESQLSNIQVTVVNFPAAAVI